MTPRIADFGLSVKLQTTLTTGMAAPTGGGRGTMQYKAPELFCTRRMDPALYERRYAKPADVYSFAMLAWEVFTGKVPWLGTPDEELVAIQVDALRHAGAIERPVAGADWAPPDVVALVEACWAQAPEVRPTFEEALSNIDYSSAAFPPDDTGRLTSAAASIVEALELQLELAEAERVRIEAAAAHRRDELQHELEEAKRNVAELGVERDAATRDRDALQGALASSDRVTFPGSWTVQCDDGGDRRTIAWWRDGSRLVDVARSDAKWAWASGLLHETLGAARLVRLERWENRLQFRDYWVKRDNLAVKRGGDSNEQWLWHGTGDTPPATVLEHEVGPDPRYSCGGFYGAQACCGRTIRCVQSR